MIAGFLFQAGWSLPTVSIILGLGASVAALMLFLARGGIARTAQSASTVGG